MPKQQEYSQEAHRTPNKVQTQLLQSNGDSHTKTKIYSTCTCTINYYSIQHGRQLTFIKTHVYNINNNKNKHHTTKLHLTGTLFSIQSFMRAGLLPDTRVHLYPMYFFSSCGAVLAVIPQTNPTNNSLNHLLCTLCISQRAFHSLLDSQTFP